MRRVLPERFAASLVLVPVMFELPRKQGCPLLVRQLQMMVSATQASRIAFAARRGALSGSHK
jgi:hypothetical protein